MEKAPEAVSEYHFIEPWSCEQDSKIIRLVQE